MILIWRNYTNWTYLFWLLLFWISFWIFASLSISEQLQWLRKEVEWWLVSEEKWRSNMVSSFRSEMKSKFQKWNGGFRNGEVKWWVVSEGNGGFRVFCIKRSLGEIKYHFGTPQMLLALLYVSIMWGPLAFFGGVLIVFFKFNFKIKYVI